MKNNEQCQAQVCTSSRWDFRGHQCTRRAVVERDGKFYCKTHDPVELAKRRERSAKESRQRCKDRERARKIKHFEFVRKYMFESDLKTLTVSEINYIIEETKGDGDE